LCGLAITTLIWNASLQALQYPYQPYDEKKMDPQLTGWPLSPEELSFVSKAAHTRRPGCERGAQKLDFLPYTPAADGQGNPNWYVGVQEQLVKVIDHYKRDHGPDVDVLLVGDSITWQWLGMSTPYSQYPQPFNAAWKSQFGQWKALTAVPQE
jgi:hypothetical protein